MQPNTENFSEQAGKSIYLPRLQLKLSKHWDSWDLFMPYEKRERQIHQEISPKEAKENYSSSIF